MNPIHSQRDFYPSMWAPLRKRGEDLNILFGRVDENQPQWHPLPHWIYDGIGGLAHLLRDLRISEARSLPRISEQYWRSGLGLRAAQARFATSQLINMRDRLTSPWRTFRAGGLSRTVLGWSVFSVEETKAVRAAARARNVTINSLLLWALNRVVARELIPGRHPWCIPVNLRGAVTGRPDTHNHVAWVFPRLSPDETLSNVHARMRSDLLAGTAAASYHFTRMTPGIVGGYRWRLAGTFSNLGDWAAVAPEEQKPWVFCPPVLSDQPLAAGTITISGRLSLLLQIHECVRSADTNFSAEDWKRTIFEAA